jgi:hypothetical protein
LLTPLGCLFSAQPQLQLLWLSGALLSGISFNEIFSCCGSPCSSPLKPVPTAATPHAIAAAYVYLVLQAANLNKNNKLCSDFTSE